MYEYDIEEEIKKEVDGLMSQWEQLLEYADKQDFAVNDFKKNFAEVTKQDVETFKSKIKEEYEQYNIKDKVEIILKKGYIILKPIPAPRKDWETAFKEMNESGDDQLLFNDVFDNEDFEKWI